MPVPQVKEAPVKDVLKVTGQKSSIKLTLKTDKGGAQGKKRVASDAETEPPAKRPTPAAPVNPKTADIKEPVRISLPRKEPLVRAQEAVSVAPKQVGPTPPPPPPPAPKPKKKSTSSRREELLQQLKAVEDAIKRKRSKIT